MSGSMLIDAESASAEASPVEPGLEGSLALSRQTTLSPDAVITSGAASPDSTLNEADQDDYPQAAATPSDESADAVPAPSIDSLADFAAADEVSAAVAADITGSAPDAEGAEQVSASPTEGPGGEAGNAPVTVAAVGAAAEAAGDESGDAAPAASMAMSIEGFDGAMGASSLVWGEPVGGGERIYYDDGTWAYTKPYDIGDAAGDVFYDILPLPAEDGGFEEEPDGWLYVEETDEWVYLGGDEDWIYLDEWEDGGYVEDDWSYLDDGEDGGYADEGDEWLYEDEDWIYLDEWEDPGYIDEDGEWVYADEGEDWVYLDEWEDWVYVDEGDESVYADEADGSNDAVSDHYVIGCWGYPDPMDGEVGDGDTVAPDGADSAGEVFTAAILPLAVDGLFIA